MAFEAKLGQELRLRQQLVMTPQLQQAIKILQLAVPELETVVQAELEQNPMLEMAEPGSGEVSLESITPARLGGRQRQRHRRGARGKHDGQRSGAPARSAGGRIARRGGGNARAATRWKRSTGASTWRITPTTGRTPRRESDDDDRRPAVENTLSRKTSLEDHLIWQLRLSPLARGPTADRRHYHLQPQ